MGATPAQTDAKKAAFLAAFAECGTIRGAKAASGVDDKTHYNWLNVDPEYVKRFEEAQRKSAKALEAEARRRAVEGWEEPVYQQGMLIGKKRRYSDTLLIFLMKGNDPAKFGDKVEQTHRGDASAPVTVYQLPDNGRDADS